MSTIVKTLRFPSPLAAALELEAEVKKISFPDLIRQVLADHLNEAERFVRIEKKLDELAASVAELGVTE